MNQNEQKFLRIGTQIYLKEIKPSGEDVLIPWTPAAIYQDYGKDRGNEIITGMEKYVGWINEPSHIDYHEVIDGKWLNLYQPLPYEPREGVDFPNIRGFLQHIFGDKYEIGLDYLQLLYLQPKQKLPILLLISQQRNTGKTTFLKFLKSIFGVNATFNGNADFQSQFNADWANKLLVMVDETFLNRKEEAERLKNLSTATVYKAEAKGKDRVEVDFHAKFVLCSNNKLCPVLIEPGETRYWVISVPSLKHDDTLLMEKLIYEIPAFLHHLMKRQLSTERRSRMWFDFHVYHTIALDRIIVNTRDRLEADIVEALWQVFEAMNIERFDVCPKDVVRLLEYSCSRRHDIDERNVRRVLQLQWELSPTDNSLTYLQYIPNSSAAEGYSTQKATGRYYTISREFVKSLTF